ncbi:hypothetical protein MKQ70_23850 [Chitinophaga sedimenti]|uniref:hypothetical protein n=1 Tax=Chitinophaga sedimenti TaxID=2033606 RepID=UPI00200622C9|nr:hypothetical protein [Chitinophaga sedimenti]MCK7557875.1 hypothetical protein [Chitinophaga sedimenti]
MFIKAPGRDAGRFALAVGLEFPAYKRFFSLATGLAGGNFVLAAPFHEFIPVLSWNNIVGVDFEPEEDIVWRIAAFVD